MSLRALLGSILLGPARRVPDDAALMYAIRARLQKLDEALDGEPNGALDENDPRTLFRFLLRMARHELSEPSPSISNPALLSRFESLIQTRPAESLHHAQLFIDTPSVLLRAETLLRTRPKGPILALGDDDAVSLALLLLGAEKVEVADIDERILAFLSERARTLFAELPVHRVDVLEEEPGPQLLGRFEIVVTDPPRSYDDGLAFIAFAARCLHPSPSSRLYYADHEDWNDEHDRLVGALRGLGLELVERHANLARYPLIEAWIPSLEDRASALGLTADALRSLIRSIPARSHLYELRFRV